MSYLWERLTAHVWPGVARAPLLPSLRSGGSTAQHGQFASAFEDAPVGMLLLDPDARVLQANRAFCQFVGMSRDEVLQASPAQLVHPEDFTAEHTARVRMLAGEQASCRRELRYLHRQGHAVWADFSCALVRDRRSRPLHFVVQVHDITERKRADERLQDMRAVLHMATQVGHLGAWAFDVGGEALFWSEEICAMLEVRQGFMPTPQQAMAFVAPESRERMRAVLGTCLKTGSPFDVEAQFVTGRGRRVWVRMLCEAQWDAEGKVRRLQGALQDVSQMRQAQQEILRLNAELEERVRQRTEQLEAANRELEAFSYSLAHDMHAPLAAIDSFCHVLEDKLGKQLDPVVQHYLRRIRAGVQQMHDLSDGLLALTQVARDDLRWERLDLAEQARSALAACHERAPERTVERRIASSLPVRGDPRLLQRVIGNLVGNAWKFTARQPHALIEIGSVQGPHGQLAYYVRDNGAGFDMAQAGKMFQAFQRLHQASDFEGTGIGLAIVHKVIARHGGQVWAESEPGRGATFYFTLGLRPSR